MGNPTAFPVDDLSPEREDILRTSSGSGERQQAGVVRQAFFRPMEVRP